MPHPTRHLARLLAVGAATLACLSASTLGAAAAPVDPAPAAASAAEQQLASVDVTYGSVEPLPGAVSVAPSPATNADKTVAVASTIRCWTLDVTRRGKNIFGGTLITLTTHTSWCGDGRWVRTRASTTYTHSNAFGWSYEGMVRKYDEYGVGWNQYHAVREAQFCLVNCLAQSKYLTNDISVGPAGQVYHR